VKREIPIAITVLCGLAIVWSFLTPSLHGDAVNSELNTWALVFFSMAFLLASATWCASASSRSPRGTPTRSTRSCCCSCSSAT